MPSLQPLRGLLLEESASGTLRALPFRKCRAGVSQEPPLLSFGENEAHSGEFKGTVATKVRMARVAGHFRRGSFLCEHWVDVAGPALGESCLGAGAAPLTPPTWSIRHSSLGSRSSEAGGSSLSQRFWQIRVRVNIRVSFSTAANSCSRRWGFDGLHA